MADLLGVALAGGQSRRMGRDKAAILLPNGKSWLAHSFELLQSVCGKAIVVTSPEMPRPGFPCIHDWPGPDGPARGVAAGLEYAHNLGMDGILVLPCDVPRMKAEILEDIRARHLAADKYLTAHVNATTGRIEMLAAAYSVAFLPILARGLKAGIPSLFQLMPPEERQIVAYGKDMAGIFQNCNMPEDI